jgi:hypothetical protein
MDNLPNCLNIEIGHICEASGECATDDSLNNCQTFDVYVRVECGGDTPTQGSLMVNHNAGQAPVTTESPLSTSAAQGDDNSEGGNEPDANALIDEEMTLNSASLSDSAPTTVTVPENATTELLVPNVTLPEIASADLSNAPVQITESSPTPNVAVQQNETSAIANLTLQTNEEDFSSAAAATFTYDRSPSGNSASSASTGEEPFADFAAKDYADADSWASTSQSYDHNEGWDLSGYFTQSARSSAGTKSGGAHILIAAAIAFAMIL